MFEIYGGSKEFNQWSLNQKVTNACMEVGDEVVFRNAHGKATVAYGRKDGGEIVADVPNEMLKYAGNILVELGQGKEKHDDCWTLFVVVPQEKPEDYVCTDNVIRPDTGGSTALGGADWNAAEGEPGHVLNRTHWAELSESAVLVPDTAISFTDGSPVMLTAPVVKLVEGKEYTVTWNGVEYKCTAQEFSMDGMTAPALGNGGAVTGGTDSGEPFAIVCLSEEIAAQAGASIVIFALAEVSAVTFSIVGYGETVHKLDGKFLPDGLPYSEYTTDVILPKSEGVYAELEIGNGFLVAGTMPKLILGQSYEVNYNGVKYKTTARTLTNMRGMTALGNLGAAGAEGEANTGEPFVVLELPSEIQAMVGACVGVMPLDGAESVTVSISGDVETVHKLDNKYLDIASAVIVNCIQDEDGIHFVDDDGEVLNYFARFTEVYKMLFEGKAVFVRIDGGSGGGTFYAASTYSAEHLYFTFMYNYYDSVAITTIDFAVDGGRGALYTKSL